MQLLREVPDCRRCSKGRTEPSMLPRPRFLVMLVTCSSAESEDFTLYTIEWMSVQMVAAQMPLDERRDERWRGGDGGDGGDGGVRSTIEYTCKPYSGIRELLEYFVGGKTV